MKHLFQHSADNPFHISVGAVVINNDGKVLVHKVTRDQVPEELRDRLEVLDTAYTLMRELLENNETLEEAIHRGVREEFGIVGDIIRYLGSTQANLFQNGHPFEKTTLYFLVQARESCERDGDDIESTTKLEWVDPETLIGNMRAQRDNVKRPDLDESKIIEAYVRLH